MEREIRIDGKPYVLTSDDDYLDAMGADFEPHMCELFKALTPPGADVVDVGGNIGLTSILFSGLARHPVFGQTCHLPQTACSKTGNGAFVAVRLSAEGIFREQ